MSAPRALEIAISVSRLAVAVPASILERCERSIPATQATWACVAPASARSRSASRPIARTVSRWRRLTSRSIPRRRLGGGIGQVNTSSLIWRSLDPANPRSIRCGSLSTLKDRTSPGGRPAVVSGRRGGSWTQHKGPLRSKSPRFQRIWWFGPQVLTASHIEARTDGSVGRGVIPMAGARSDRTIRGP